MINIMFVGLLISVIVGYYRYLVNLPINAIVILPYALALIIAVIYDGIRDKRRI